MKIDVVTLFEKMIDSPLSESIPGRARKEKKLKLGFSNPRDFTTDRHRTVDDKPYGGGVGMIMMAEPVYLALKKVKKKDSFTILLSPRGKKLDQKTVKSLSRKKRLVIVCGRYEGIDERISDCVDMELSLGDYIMSGGEPAAVVLIDAITRLLPGVLKKKEAVLKESFDESLLEAPQYTRPKIWRGKKVPDILTGGNHDLIEKWKLEKAKAITKKRRPDLLKQKRRT
jgi:tRNA (guanine37-N1)-methyltransferase